MDSNTCSQEGKSHFGRANTTSQEQERHIALEGRAGPAQAQGCTLRRRGESAAPQPADRRCILSPSLLLLWGPLHWLLDLLLLLLAGDGCHWTLPGHSDHGALGLQDHHWCHVLHGAHFVADDLLGAMAGRAAAVAGGALIAVAASVSTGAHFLIGARSLGRRKPS